MADGRPRGMRRVSAIQHDLDAIVARDYTAMEELHRVFTRPGKPGAVSRGKVTLS
jgi:molybdopterin biosynthesis enzyme MoaB